MEQHPVPQNVTSFQFKLIGDITLKQFAYVAGGVILGYICTQLGIIPSLLRFPLAAFTFIFGIALAFLPIEERPMDRWVINFFKSIYAPTQFIWKKDNPVPEILKQQLVMQTVPAPNQQIPTLQVQPVNIPPPKPPETPKPKASPALPVKPSNQMPNFASPPVIKKPIIPPRQPFVSQRPPSTRPPPQPLKVTPVKPKAESWTIGAPPVFRKPQAQVSAGVKPVTGQRIVFEEPKPTATVPKADPRQLAQMKSNYQELEKRLNQQMQTMQLELQKGNVTKERFLELQKLLSQLLAEKDRMSTELEYLRKQLEEGQKSTPVRPTEYKTMPQERTTIKIVPPQMAVQAGLPQLTSYPNIITGIVKDTSGNLLPGVILTVKDREGLPVRALKTNKVGQFAASTPLANNVYIIEVEDPQKKYQFDRIEVTLSNQILPPLEITAISQRDLSRQKLHQEIFGQKTV